MTRKVLVLIILGIVMLLANGLLVYEELSPEDNLAAQSCGIVAYDWDKPVTELEHGFPSYQGSNILNNSDWTKPVNYAQGTLYYRAQIKSQPKQQDGMHLQLCFWQAHPNPSINPDNFYNENCGTQRNVKGASGNVQTWSVGVENMWKHHDRPIDWDRPRFRVGVAVKKTNNIPVSDYNGWNWNGEDPKEWYPLNMRFTTVVVPKDGTFCGWDYYLGGSSTTPPPTPTHTTVPTSTINPSATVTPSSTSVPSLSPTPTNTNPPVNTAIPSATNPQGSICGKADSDGNGVFTIGDFAGFARAYGNGKNTCADKDVDYGPCGGRDVNKDGKLNLFDFGGTGVGFAQRYYPKISCALN